MRRQLFQRTILENRWLIHRPHPKQAIFLFLECFEALFGGSAGPGKSEALLMAALQFVDVSGYAAIIFRRSFTDLCKPGALIDRAHEWLDGSAARWDAINHTWHFPSGAKLTFGYLENDRDVYHHQSAEYQFIGFDELTQFTEFQYRYMLSRLRRLKNSYVPLRVRSASNPGGVGHDWVKQRFIVEGALHGRVFVRAFLDDNPSLDRESYRKSLDNLDPVTRKQLLEGDWDVKDTFMFRREWFVGSAQYPGRRLVDAHEVPQEMRLVRVWDFAKTAEGAGGNPDFTSGLKAGLHKGVMYILDVRHFRGSPQLIEQNVRECAELDGVCVPVHIEEENGAAGKNLLDQYRRNVLLGYVVNGEPPTGKKTVRAAPFSSAAEAGNVRLLRGVWNSVFLDELEAFPEGAHDDQVDVAAYAYNILCGAARAPKVRHA